MMEENKEIFLAGGDAGVLDRTNTQKVFYSTTFAWGHPFSMYVSYDQFFNSPVRTCTHFG